MRLKKEFEKNLIHSLKIIADDLCSYLDVKYKSFSQLLPSNEYYYNSMGINDNGHIKIRLKNKSNRYYSLSYLVDTTIHEIAHLVHYRHDKKFWKLYNTLKDYIRKNLDERLLFAR